MKNSVPQSHWTHFFLAVLGLRCCAGSSLLCWVFVAVHGRSLVAESRGYSVAVQGFLLQWLLL